MFPKKKSNFLKISYLEQADISHTGKGPRVHDFRHAYCVNLLRKWVDEGKILSHIFLTCEQYLDMKNLKKQHIISN